MNTSGLNTPKSHLVIAIAVYLILKSIQLLFAVPGAEIGGDAAMKWELARQLSMGDIALLSTEQISHHYLRWGSWLTPYVLISMFSDDMAIYYLSSALPSILGGCVLTYIVCKYTGFKWGMLFAVVFAIDIQMYRATFQLLPTAAAMLPVAFLILYCFESEKFSRPGYSILILFALCFWLYGAKETNLFFFPGAAFFVLLRLGFNWSVAFTMLCLLGYVAETAFLNYLSPDISNFGRIAELLDSNSNHFGGILSAEKPIHPVDYGVFSRWITNNTILHDFLYVISIAVFFSSLVAVIVTRKTVKVISPLATISIFGMSFVVLTSLFFVSFDPLRMGQPMRPRYIAVLLPFSYVAVILVMSYISRSSLFCIDSFDRQRKIFAEVLQALLVVIFIGFSVNQFLLGTQSDSWGNGLTDRSDCYRELGIEIENGHCYVSRGRSGKDMRYLPLYVPMEARGSQYDHFIGATRFKEGKNYRKKTSDTCESYTDLNKLRMQCGPSLPAK